MGSVNPKLVQKPSVTSAERSMAINFEPKRSDSNLIGSLPEKQVEHESKDTRKSISPKNEKPTERQITFENETNSVLLKAVEVAFNKELAKICLPSYANLLVEELIKFDDIRSSTAGNILEFLYHFTISTVRGVQSAATWINQLGHTNYAKWLSRIWPNLFDPNPFSDQTEKRYLSNFRRCLGILWNSCDSSLEMCTKVTEHHLIQKLVEIIKMPEFNQNIVSKPIPLINAIHATTGIIHNCMRNHFEETKKQFRAADGVSAFKQFLGENYEQNRGVQAKTSMVLAYGINEEENEIISISQNVLKFVVDRLLKFTVRSADHRSSLYGFSAEETIAALNAIAVNDSNKLLIVQLGALDYYMIIIQTYLNVKELATAVKGFWILSFKPENHEKIQAVPDAMRKMEELSKFSNEDVKRAAEGVLWNIRSLTENEEKSRRDKQKGSTDFEPVYKHVMLSYSWAHKPVVKLIKEELKKAGYTTWLDEDQMSGSTLDAMARAIENSEVVIVFFSENYKNSLSCRTEAEYAFRLRKAIVPVRTQPKYVADGWLGMFLGTKLYFDCMSVEDVPSASVRIIKELGNRGKLSRKESTSSLGSSIKSGNQQDCRNWSKQEVQDWLRSSDLDFLTEKLIDYDGPLLMELYLMNQRAPAIFYTSLKEDLCIKNLTEILRFTQKLTSL